MVREKPLVFNDIRKPKPPSDDPVYDAKYERARQTALKWGYILSRAEEAKRGLNLYGRLNPEQKKAIQPFVRGHQVHDLGAGDLNLAVELLKLGATGVTAIDKEDPPKKTLDPAITYTKALFSAFAKLQADVAFVAWPMNHANPDLNEICMNAQTVIYLGKNTDGTACGDRSLFDIFLYRKLLAYVPHRDNTLIILGKTLRKPRKPTGEERAGIAHWSEGVLRYDDVETT